MAAWLPVLGTDRLASGASGCYPMAPWQRVKKSQGCFNNFQVPYKQQYANQNVHSSCFGGQSVKSWNSGRRWGQINQTETQTSADLCGLLDCSFFSFWTNTKKTLNLISDLCRRPIKGPSGWSQRGSVQPHHIFEDQSQGFLGVDDVMEQHDVGMLQAFQKRCCRHRTGKQLMGSTCWETRESMPSLAASLEFNTGPLWASLHTYRGSRKD